MSDHAPVPPDPQTAPALAEIRRLYFSATRATIEHDFGRAIDLLKSMSGPETRERAAVYMEGLAQMRAEWLGGPRNRRQRGGGSKDPPLPK